MNKRPLIATEIDFSTIRNSTRGQSDSFEKLVCQIASKDPAYIGLGHFSRFHGAGGDGGVEAIWELHNGDIIGYQAKYYPLGTRIHWGKIEKSIETALRNYDRLVTYVIAIPRDLTGPKSSGKLGKSGRDRWVKLTERWRLYCETSGRRPVNFILQDAHALEMLLQSPAYAGLSAYWFQGQFLEANWFRNHLTDSIANLEERYSPQDHVDVQSQSFMALIDQPILLHKDIENFIEKVRLTAQKIETCLLNLDPLPAPLKSNISAKLKNLHDLCESIISDHKKSQLNSERRQMIVGLKSLALSVLAKLDQIETKSLLEWQKEVRKKHPMFWDDSDDYSEDKVAVKTSEEPSMEEILRSIRRIIYEDQDIGENSWETAPEGSAKTDLLLRRITNSRKLFVDFNARLNNADARFEYSQLAILIGPAGIGKSHLLAHCAEQLHSKGHPVVFLLGQHFSAGDPWSLALQRMGLVNTDRDSFLAGLNSTAEACQKRAIIIVDAINESADGRFWNSSLPGFMAAINRYSSIVAVISCRDVYVDSIVPKSLLDKAAIVPCEGFTTREEQEAAARQYLDKRGIKRPALPWLSPEFNNPLFLRSCCEALRREGRTEFPRGLRGIKETLHFYLDSIGKSLAADIPTAVNPTQHLRRAVAILANAMAQAKTDYIYLHDAHALLDNVLPSHGQSWVYTLRQNGILRFDPNPNLEGSNQDTDLNVLRFAFQRFSDYLIADSLCVQITNIDASFHNGGMFDESGIKHGPLAFLFSENSGNVEINGMWKGLFSALCVASAENFGEELLLLFPKHVFRNLVTSDQATLHECFTWRSIESFTNKSNLILDMLLDGARRGSSDRFEYDFGVLDLLMQVSIVDGHPWNANLLRNFLLSIPREYRGDYWNSYADYSSHMKTLQDWSQSPDITDAHHCTALLTATLLSFCLCDPNHSNYRRASVSLSRLLSTFPELWVEIIERFCSPNFFSERHALLSIAFSHICRDAQSTLAKNIVQWIEGFLNRREYDQVDIISRRLITGIQHAYCWNTDASTYRDQRITTKASHSSSFLKFMARNKFALSEEGESKFSTDRKMFLELFPDIHELIKKSFSEISLTDSSHESIMDMYSSSLNSRDPQTGSWAEFLSYTIRHPITSLSTHIHPTNADAGLSSYTRSLNANYHLFLLWRYIIGSTESNLLSHLNDDEIIYYATYISPLLFPDRKQEPTSISITKRDSDIFLSISYWIVALWDGEIGTEADPSHIARRAYEIHHALMQRADYSLYSLYQKQCLYQIIAYLGENYWYLTKDRSLGRRFSFENDLPVFRSFDPTTALAAPSLQNPRAFPERDELRKWMIQTANSHLDHFGKNFVHRSTDIRKFQGLETSLRSVVVSDSSLLSFTHDSYGDWTMLYGFAESEPGAGTAVYSLLSPANGIDAAIEVVRKYSAQIVDQFEPQDFENGPLLGEFPWAPRWLEENDSGARIDPETSISFFPTVSRFHRTERFDVYSNFGSNDRTHELHFCLLTAWLSRKLHARPDMNDYGVILDDRGEVMFVDPQPGMTGSIAAFIRTDALNRVLSAHDLQPIWAIKSFNRLS